MDYSKYDRILYQDLAVWIGVGVLIIAICCVSLVCLFKNMPKKKYVGWILFILIVALMIGTPALIIPDATDTISDIKNQAYVKYEGEFMVVYDQQTPSRACSIVLPDGRRFNTSVYMRDEGTYRGYVIYAEKTNKLICYEVT